VSARGAKWLAVAAAAMVLTGVGLLAQRLWVFAHTRPAVGTVIAREPYGYTVSFETDAGVVHFTQRLPGSKEESDQLEVGLQVPVRYGPGEVPDAKVISPSFWYFPLGFLFVGLLGVAAAVYARRNARPG
jgi:hypothetical protein